MRNIQFPHSPSEMRFHTMESLEILWVGNIANNSNSPQKLEQHDEKSWRRANKS